MKKNNGKNEIRTDGEKKLLHNRLNRLIGQLNGIKAMVDDDRSCDDIIVQLSAAEKAVISLSNHVLEEHLREYANKKIGPRNIENIDEFISIFKKFNK